MQAGLNNDPLAFNDIVAINAVAATSDQTSVDCVNLTGRGVRVTLVTTAIGSATVTLHIQAKDVASGEYIDMLVGTGVIANATTVYRVHPDLAAVANSVAQDVLPHTFRVKVVHTDANPATYSVGCSILQ